MTEYTKNKNKFLIHLLIWVSFGLIFFIVSYAAGRRMRFQFIEKMFIDIAIFYINYLVLVPYLLLKKKKKFYFISVVVILFTSFLIFTYALPVPDFVSDRKIPEGIPRGLPMAISGLFPIVIGTSIRIYEEWNKNERNKKEIEAQKSTAELHFLKNQLSPHFLFNSLNSIYSLTKKKSNDAPEAVITLSELMRYMLYETNNGFVLLKNELNYVQNYLKLQRLRIANNENVTLNIHGSISNQKIRPLLLISFIENAFKYGTDFKGNTEVKIKIYVKEHELQFTCINLIGSRKKDTGNSGIGLQNTRERLDLLYHEKHWLLVEEKNNRFVVNLTLKLE